MWFVVRLHSVLVVGDSVTVVAGETPGEGAGREHLKESLQIAKPVTLFESFRPDNSGQVKELVVV